MDLPKHNSSTVIEETTNQTKSQQINPTLVFGGSGQPEYLGKNLLCQSTEATIQAICSAKVKN